MLFIGVALLAAVGFALVIASDAGSLIGLTEQDTVRLIPLLIILVVIAGGAFNRRQKLGEMLANLMLWGCIFVVAGVGYTYRFELNQVGQRVLAELQPGAAVVDVDNHSAMFRRSVNGSFRVNARINDASTTLIFDTGATAVFLTQEDARAAGIDVSQLSFSLPIQTANGTGRAASVTLGMLSVGDISRQNVRAFVAEKDALETSLLGMTYLSTLSGFSVKNDSLILND